MVIQSYNHGQKGKVLIDLLDKKSSDPDVHKEAIQILNSDGSIDYAKEKAILVMRRAWENIECKLPNNQAK